MIIGLLSVDLHLASSRSLKDKRSVIRRLKDRLRGCNVAIAEVEYHDLQQRAGLGMVAIGVDQNIVERTFASTVKEIERVEPGVITRSELDWLT